MNSERRPEVTGEFSDLGAQSDYKLILTKLNDLIKAQLQLIFSSSTKNSEEDNATSNLNSEKGSPTTRSSHGERKVQILNNGNDKDNSSWQNNSSKQIPSMMGKAKKRSRKDYFNLFLQTAEMLSTDLFLVLLSPFFIFPLLLINHLIRLLVKLYLRYKTKGKIQLMRGEDAFWACETPQDPGNFTSVYIMEGVPCLEKIRARLNSSWVQRKDTKGNYMFLQLKQKPVKLLRSTYFGWEVDEAFDISNHVKYFHTEDPHRVVSEAGLFHAIESIYSQLMPINKPQWEVLLVPNYVYDQEALKPPSQRKPHYALVFRVCHSIMDGISAAQGLRVLLADNVVEAGMDPLKPIKMSLLEKAMLYIAAVFLCGPYLLRNLYTRESNPFHGPASSPSKSLTWSRPIRLCGIKSLKERTGSSVTSVITSCIGAAFHSHAMRKGIPPSSCEKVTAATCAAVLPYPSIKAQNRFCVVFSPIHCKDMKGPLARLRKSLITRSRLHSFAEVTMAYWITWLGGCLPIPITNFLQNRICQGTIVISNLPGPKSTAQIFGGDAITDVIGWSPIRNGIGVGMCIFSYNGRIRANVVADKSVFPEGEKDVREFVGYFEKELLALGRCCGLRENDLFELEGTRIKENAVRDLDGDNNKNILNGVRRKERTQTWSYSEEYQKSGGIKRRVVI